MSNMERTTIRIPKQVLRNIEDAADNGEFASRSAAIRYALQRTFKTDSVRDRQGDGNE